LMKLNSFNFLTSSSTTWFLSSPIFLWETHLTWGSKDSLWVMTSLSTFSLLQQPLELCPKWVIWWSKLPIRTSSISSNGLTLLSSRSSWGSKSATF
jgi:hypothetical protein